MVKERFELIIVALGELTQVSKQRKRMKERPKENKKVLNVKKEVMKESVRRKMNKDVSTFFDYKMNIMLKKNCSAVACQCTCVPSTKKNVRVVCAPSLV